MSLQIHIPNLKSISQKTTEKSPENRSVTDLLTASKQWVPQQADRGLINNPISMLFELFKAQCIMTSLPIVTPHQLQIATTWHHTCCLTPPTHPLKIHLFVPMYFWDISIHGGRKTLCVLYSEVTLHRWWHWSAHILRSNLESKFGNFMSVKTSLALCKCMHKQNRITRQTDGW